MDLKFNFEDIILYEDNHLLVVNKPAGIPVQSDKSGDACMIDLAKHYLVNKYNKSGEAYLGLVHRLDRPVSGVLLLAKTSKAMTRLSEQFRSKKTFKKYFAVTNKKAINKKAKIESFLLKDRQKNKVRSFKENKNGAKHAITKIELIEKKNNIFLYKLSPITGRSHQLRVHLSTHDAPIIGDVKYNGIKHQDVKSILLHSYYLACTHPTKKESIEFTCLPKGKVWTSLVIWPEIKNVMKTKKYSD